MHVLRKRSQLDLVIDWCDGWWGTGEEVWFLAHTAEGTVRTLLRPGHLRRETQRLRTGSGWGRGCEQILSGAVHIGHLSEGVEKTVVFIGRCSAKQSAQTYGSWKCR